MGVFKWVNRVVFGAESLAKSAAGKAKDKGEDALDKAEDMFDDLADKAGDMLSKGKQEAEKAGKKLKSKAEEWKDKAEDVVDDISENIRPSVDEAKGIVKDAAGKVKSKASAFYDKAKDKVDDITDKDDDPVADDIITEMRDPVSDVAAKVSDTASDMGDDIKSTMDDLADADMSEVKEEANELLDRAKNIAEATGAKILGTDKNPDAAQDPLVDKASDFVSDKLEKAKDLVDKASEKINEKIDDTLAKAKKLEEEEALEKAKNPTGIREDSTHADALKGSLLGGTESFFDKASRYADGDYSAAAEGKMTIKENENVVEKNKGTVKGFEDLDGDGDEIVDDAILDDDE